MKKIRKSVFETNSSSMHSVVVSRDVPYEWEDKTCFRDWLTDDNKVSVDFGEFGWGFDKFYGAVDKLSYLVTLIREINRYETNEEIYQDENFIKVEEAVKAYCGCDGIEINEDSLEGYIDHQSIVDFDGFLAEHDLTIEEFLFYEGVALIIDNDNH